mgnify:CR=1 FL=1
MVAEDITSRFLNVISLFNGVIPIVAVQMTAAEVDGRRTIVFTKVLDLTALGGKGKPASDDPPPSSREHWEKKASPEILGLADKVIELALEVFPEDVAGELKYLTNRIDVKRKTGKTAAYCFPKKKHLRLAVPMNRSTETDEMLEASGLDTLSYNSKLNRYRVRLTGDGDQDWPAVRELLRRSLEEQA